MADRLDTLRSYVADAAARAARRLAEVPAVGRLRRRLAQAQRGVLAIAEADLTAALAHAPGVRSATVLARRDALHLDLAFDDGGSWIGSLVPDSVRFAPRGAKEVGFRVEPPERAGDGRLRDVVAVLGGVLARTLWSMLVPPRTPRGLAGNVLREDGGWRVDLRSVPEIRRIPPGSPLGQALDLLELRELRCDDGELRLRVGLPEGLAGGPPG